VPNEIVIESSADTLYAATLLIFAAAMLLESLLPRRSLRGGLLWRWANNFSLSLLSWYVTAVVGTLLVMRVAEWTNFRGTGLFATLEAPVVVQFLVLLTVTQFISYWLHRAFHHVPALWTLHAVHHSDTDLDVSTTFRHHPLEPLLSVPVSLPAVIFLGVAPQAALIYRLFDVFFQVFSHSNIRVPEALERILRPVLLTPDFHRIHHNAESRFTNSNYGSLVPWFDYLFGTARRQPFKAQESTELGLEYLREPVDSRLDRLLLAPLRVWRLRRAQANAQPTRRQRADALTGAAALRWSWYPGGRRRSPGWRHR
jgi:sterol desaturase/sphingolipid hydroxylase (fatty acid hydroxylase superfamily)